MIVDRINNTVVITQERASIPELVKRLNDMYQKIKNDNIIVNLNSLKKNTIDDALEFLEFSNTHRSNLHSFVLVSSTMDLNESPDEIVVVPTTQEAYDIIDMEEMERDLGF